METNDKQEVGLECVGVIVERRPLLRGRSAASSCAVTPLARLWGDIQELSPPPVCASPLHPLSSLLLVLLLPPPDDRSSAASGLDVADRLTYLEQRMQMQEDEIQLLKMALADVLKRLNISEEHQAAATAAVATGSRKPLGAKGESEICCLYR